ncbi:hypothetical protein Ddye_021748 [Dipteronia dyeriana]|uniref:Uncharacterized protein n=1 Tax=Dipteronia dyeriana TaxID=168575 RepID=A0AAD9U2X9_9ROSI|nr:hypothetical protein Ddye_021748 [Dipteronia dyeriana]
MTGNGLQSKLDNKHELFLTPNNMCSTWVNYVQVSSWEGSGNQDVDLNLIKNMKFDSVEDARSFYLGYARGDGFGIRATNLDYENEAFTSYKWAITKLMDSMGNKLSFSIKTDEVEAMRQAINEISLILSHLKSLEKHAFSIYTYCSNYDITKEINDSINCSHIAPWNDENEVLYVLAEYDSPDKKTMSVVYDRDIIKFQQVIEDGDWDSSKHNLSVLSSESVDDIRIHLQPDDGYSKSVDIVQFISLSAECIYLCHQGSQTEEGFNLIIRELNIL